MPFHFTRGLLTEGEQADHAVIAGGRHAVVLAIERDGPLRTRREPGFQRSPSHPGSSGRRPGGRDVTGDAQIRAVGKLLEVVQEQNLGVAMRNTMKGEDDNDG